MNLKILIILVYLLPSTLFSQNVKNDNSYGELIFGYNKSTNNNNYKFIGLGLAANNKINNNFFLNLLVDFNYNINKEKTTNIFNITPNIRLISGGNEGFKIFFDAGSGFSVIKKGVGGINSLLNFGIGYAKYNLVFSSRFYSLENDKFTTLGIYLSYTFD
jgi:hypothetical protein